MKLSERTERWLLNVAPPHIASDENPTTYEDVKDFVHANERYHVFSGGTPIENTIFSSRAVQYAYRAWHDSIRLKFNLPFDKQSELRVANLQKSIALGADIERRDAVLLELDLRAHILYYYAAGERHPDYQIELISDVFEYGEDDVMDAVSYDRAVYDGKTLKRYMP